MSESTKPCKKCKLAIDSRAQRCQHCQADLRNFFVQHYILSVFIALFIVIILKIAVGDSTDSGNSTSSSSRNTSDATEIVSRSFNDYANYCVPDATTLQKETEFNDKFKNKYVQWTGEVTRVDADSIQVKHCPGTFLSDVVVTMKDGQTNNLLELKNGEQVTYKARVTRYGDLLGLSADNGEIVK